MAKASPRHRAARLARSPRGGRPRSSAGLINEAPVAVICVDRKGRVDDWNPAAERLFGWRREEVIGRVLPHIPSDERKRSKDSFKRVLSGETIRGVELLRRRKDGSLVNVNVSAGPLRGPGGRVRGAVGVFADAPTRDRGDVGAGQLQVPIQDLLDSAADAVASLDAPEHRGTKRGIAGIEAGYRTLFERNPYPMWVYDLKTLRFLAVNDAAVEHYGYSQKEFLEMSIKDIRPPEDLPRLLDEVARSEAERGEPQFWKAGLWKHLKKDGTVFDVDVRSTNLIYAGGLARVVLARDVSVEKRLEDQLRQAHKMDAVGRLAGGVAHDFNNILGVITGYAEIVQRTLPAEDPRGRKLGEVLKAAERATALTRQLLSFSRKEPREPKIFNLNTVVSGMEKMLQRLIGESITLEAVPQQDLWLVEADPGNMEQVLMNLTINARDAMPQGGRLILETRNVEIDETIARTYLTLKPGPHVVLSVSDTGEGMDTEVQSHIFEPFFTTKAKDKGTGLGLSIVYGIVRQSRGHIQVYSHPGRGTTFNLYLPRAGRDEANASEAREEMSPPQRGSETILLVEDDEALRSLAREVLSSNGYTVLEAADGSEVAAASAGRRIDLVLSDMVLRTTTGTAIAQELKRTRPDLRVLYMSGYSDRALVSQGGLTGGESFLQKPFTPDALLRKVRELLDQNPA